MQAVACNLGSRSDKAQVLQHLMKQNYILRETMAEFGILDDVYNAEKSGMCSKVSAL